MSAEHKEVNMASGSQAQAALRLQGAGFVKSRPQHEARCSGCKHVDFASGSFGHTKYDRYCKLLQAGVKTHGHCRMYAGSGVQR